MNTYSSGGRPIPSPTRPQTMPEYGIPTNNEGMLDWSFIEARMPAARNYWVTSVNAHNHPHAMPVWGAWVDGVFYFGGGKETNTVRNLMKNPHVVIHLESGDEVIILRGEVQVVTEDLDADTYERIEQQYEKKYNMRHGLPNFSLTPKSVMAWKEYPVSCTKWEFEK